jgi:hypothetical protein
MATRFHLYLILVIALVTADVYTFSPLSMKTEFRNKYGEMKNPMPSSLANFGNPPYGSTMVGRVFYQKQTDAENPEDRNKCLACDILHPIIFTRDPDNIDTPILMVDRGKCSFV